MRIDGQGPQTVALNKVSVRRGKEATFRYRVSDVTPKATVAIKLFKGAKLLKTIKVGNKDSNSAQSYKWKCSLAGNKQQTIGKKALTVK